MDGVILSHHNVSQKDSAEQHGESAVILCHARGGGKERMRLIALGGGCGPHPAVPCTKVLLT